MAIYIPAWHTKRKYTQHGMGTGSCNGPNQFSPSLPRLQSNQNRTQSAQEIASNSLE
jgi:hypothetical protein